MVVGQVGLISLLSSFAALLTYELIAAAVNFWFVHDDVFKNARRSLGYDDTELFKSLSLFEASLMVFALVSIAVILAAWILQSSAFGMPSPLERAARSATGAHARIPDLIENLTRAS
jgi:hypothetical protein